MGYFDNPDFQEKVNAEAKKQLSIYNPGVHDIYFLSAEKLISKKGEPFLILKFGDKEHKPIKKMFGWKSKYAKEEITRLGTWIEVALGGKVSEAVNSPLNDAEEVEQIAAYMGKFKNQKVRVAVKVIEKLLSKEEPKDSGEFVLIKYKENDIFMVTNTRRDLVINDMSKLYKKLSLEEEDRYNNYLAEKKRKKQEESSVESQSKEPEDPIEGFDIGDEDVPF